MKASLFLILLTFSLTAFSRQYIQCSNVSSNDPFYIVVNLQTSDAGTLFATPGTETDDHLLLKIKKVSETENTAIFQTEESQTPATLEILKSDLGKKSDDLKIILSFSGVQLDMSCFSRIYEE